MSAAILALVASAALVLANAFFVASEFAMVKIRPTRLEQLAGQGRRRARLALGITRQLDAYLSANQLGITLASLALGWLGEPAFARLFAMVFGLEGGSEHIAAIAGGLFTITFLHTVLGELAPKSLAIQKTEAVALWTALPLRAFYLLAFPLIWTLNKAAALSLRLLHLRPMSESEPGGHTAEELRLILHHVALDPGARRLIDRVFDYTHRVAHHVMTLRRDVVYLETGLSFRLNLRRVLDHQFTRYPLLDSDTGMIRGYVHLKDLMAELAHGGTAEIASLAREPIYATENVALEQLRREFQRRRVHLAIIRDRHGEWSGIVTLEDLLEEFVGEIQDEQDVGEVPPIVWREGGGFEVDGRITFDVAERELGVHVTASGSQVDTLGAWVTTQLGHTARVGDHVLFDGYRFTVVDVRDRRVRRLRGEPFTL